MRRAERLFRIVQWVRGRRLTTAEWLAARLEVSPRTIYRDIAELQAQGVPIDGEAGVGYRMRPGFELPALMFTRTEAQALVAAIRIAQPRLDTRFAAEAEMALAKILSVLPSAARAAAESLPLYAPAGGPDAVTRDRLALLREAIDARHVIFVVYHDVRDRPSRRRLRPLALVFWDSVWTLAAWCERREDFRNFRVDRFESLDVLPDRFADEPGRTLPDLLRRVNA